MDSIQKSKTVEEQKKMDKDNLPLQGDKEVE